MKPTDLALIFAGAATSTVLALASTMAHGPTLIAELEGRAGRALADSGVTADFRGSRGWLTRHPTLAGGVDLSDQRRAALAATVAALPGIGGVRWAARIRPVSDAPPPEQDCQQGVDGALKARSLRFAEASAELDPASVAVLDEVAAALKPCAGSVIAITGHTDGAGDEAANIALSQSRAGAVQQALIARGIPAAGLRARGLGSATPLDGLAPDDAANRRIEFEVISIKALQPTPVDLPGAG